MATGDSSDLLSRLQRLVPPWFGRSDLSPVVNSALQGVAWALSFAYSLYAFAVLQTRLATMNGGWLDLAAGDYFGDDLRRFGAEQDATYSRRIRLEVLRDRNTRNGIDRAVYDLTANHPTIFEAFRPADCGGLGTYSLVCGQAGGWGSAGAAFQVIVATPAPTGYGIPNLPGWDATTGGIDATFVLTNDTDFVANGPTPLNVLNALERVRTAGITYFVRFV
jgi:hypothetical protein